MNVYLFMGTHLGEMSHCIAHLAKTDESGHPIHVHVPEGLTWESPAENAYTLHIYDSESVQWVFDPDGEATVFIVLDPTASPVFQLEQLAEDLGKCLIEPVKVVTCVDCAAAENSPQLRTYLEACVYYSDIVLLGNRLDASKFFIRDYQSQFERNCFPCLFALLKGSGRPDKPLQILAPDTRRLSQLFDLAEESPEPVPGMVIEASCDLDLQERELDPYRPEPAEQGAPATIPDISSLIVQTD